MQHVSEEAYKHPESVWIKYWLKTMGDYHDLFLKSDVLLLGDVFENFRMTCKENNKLDLCHYAMLKMTHIEFELMADIDMF